ncbi:MAG: hypothetical protein Q8Q35_00580 [Nanoarchaeota archaeon]|nr:hypothetical protein [Nanoarchaeota archaeon]
MTFFKSFKEGMNNFGQKIAIIINTALLSLVYIIGVGLTSLVAKILNKNFLDTKLSKDKSYWKDLNLKKKPIESYYKQF